MAKASKKGLLMQVTGQFGDQCVFRESNKQLIMSQKTHRKFIYTPARLKQQEIYRQAAYRASYSLHDPEKRARYEAARKPGQTAYNVALSEFLLMLGAGKDEPTPTPVPQAPKAPRNGRRKKKVKEIAMILDTADGMLTEGNVVIPDETIEAILNVAQQKTSHKVNKITLVINYH
jgi:hypothetical protein